jgi:hypothetical protein
MSNYWSIYLWINIIWLTLEKTNIWMILMHIDECQAISGFVFWGYFVKMNYMSPKNVVA